MSAGPRMALVWTAPRGEPAVEEPVCVVADGEVLREGTSLSLARPSDLRPHVRPIGEAILKWGMAVVPVDEAGADAGGLLCFPPSVDASKLIPPLDSPPRAPPCSMTAVEEGGGEEKEEQEGAPLSRRVPLVRTREEEDAPLSRRVPLVRKREEEEALLSPKRPKAGGAAVIGAGTALLFRRPTGLLVCPFGIGERTEADLLSFYSQVEWFQRFPRFPSTAHHNGHHCMAADHSVIASAVEEALRFVGALSSHPTLGRMRACPNEVSVATMLHKPGWGLSAHIDVFAPDGVGLVLMIVVATTRAAHRTFRFTQPGAHYDVQTPSRTVLCFSDEAYEEWMHESVRNPKQDGDCISLTVRLREIDGYSGWSVPASVSAQAKAVGMTSAAYRSHKFAKQKMTERIERRKRAGAGGE